MKDNLRKGREHLPYAVPYGKQNISQADIDAVVSVLNSDYLTQGPNVPIFEKSIANKTNATHAVAAHSATAALHIACIALGVGPGDMVWTVPTTFVASANCAIYCGADIDFVDIDPVRYTMCPKALRKKLEQTGKPPKVIIPVHLCGQSADMKAIQKIAKEYGIRIIEDASHGIGASYDNAPVGNCRYSDIAVFSFHPVKIVTTAEGGVATTNSAKLAQSMALARSHGVTRDPELMESNSVGPWHYEQIMLGFNYRMTDLQAALGTSQMTRLNKIVERRAKLAARYDEMLQEMPLKTPIQSLNTASSWHLYVIRVDVDRHKTIFEFLQSQNIGVNLHYMPVHLQPFYQRRGFKPGQFPNAEAYAKEAISIPLYYGLTNENQDFVVKNLRTALL
jgi:UDP-4-amino-4,6-dideoxy-N-acetyl-beta-L-altrosamine transaminase